MPRDRALDRLRGFHDSWIDDEARRLRLQETVLRVLRLHGCRQVDVPLLEPTELFLRKNGAEMAAKLYSFTDLGRRDVALRPEFTASVMRGIAERNLDGLWPLRLSYCGPVFRYERPQWGTSRQFTQAGAEFLGAGGAASDVEVIRLACAATEAAGLREYRLVVGHLGMVTALLERLGLEPHLRQFIVANVEYYNRGPRERDDIHTRLGLASEEDAETGEGYEPDGLDAVAGDTATVLEPALAGAGADDAHDMLSRLLADLELNLTSSTRTPDEIVSRLLRKAQRRDQRGAIRQALDFVARLGAIQGPPERALESGKALLRDSGVHDAPLENLRAIVDGLDAAGFDWGRGTLHLGLARGIPYYTGMIFELLSTGDRPLQLCGGGRYDGLARTLTGGPDVPALGFAFRMERLLLATQEAGHVPVLSPPPVAVHSAAACGTATAGLAVSALRAAEIAAELDTEPRPLRAVLARARRLDQDVVVMSGQDAGGPAEETVTVHYLPGERRHNGVKVGQLAALVRGLREGSPTGGR